MEERKEGGNNKILIGWKLSLLLSCSVMFTEGAAELDQDQLLHLKPQPPSSCYRPLLVAQSGLRERGTGEDSLGRCRDHPGIKLRTV